MPVKPSEKTMKSVYTQLEAGEEIAVTEGVLIQLKEDNYKVHSNYLGNYTWKKDFWFNAYRVSKCIDVSSE